MGQHLTPLRVLVVEDDDDTRETFALLVRLAGHDVRTAPDGPSALALAPGYQPHVVFLDVAMPGMDGWAVARQLRANPATRQARIVNVTGYAREVDRQRSLDAGCDELWTKPVAPEQLAGLLESLKRVQAGEQG
jgi:CheY-like chemotaxis protein